MRGRVVDAQGDPLPGVTVTLSDPEAPADTRGAVTDDTGRFNLPSLPVGRHYVVQFSFPGMATVALSPVEVSSGRVTDLKVIMQPQENLTERIVVRASPQVVDLSTTTTETRFESEYIESLPILGRNYQDILTLAPGVTDVDGDGNPNIHGSRDTDVVTLVDGVSTVDPLTGQVGQQLNIESIQEIEVKSSGASAEFSRGQGGFVNVVTKSGGNDFEGSVKFFWRSNILDGDGAGSPDPRLHGGVSDVGLRDLEFDDFTAFLSLSGPLVRDRAWYFLTAEYIQVEDPVNALTHSFVRGVEERRIFGKLSWDMSANNKLVFSVTVDPQEFRNLGIDSFTALESGYTFQAGGTNLVLKETAIFTPNLFLETTLQHFSSEPARIPTIDPDTNGNGILYVDWDNDGVLHAHERDPGEDYDRDGRWDVFESDLPVHYNPDQDRDYDGHLTPLSGCEGETREDRNCNGVLDEGEDRNGNGYLDDRPFPMFNEEIVVNDGPVISLAGFYPYEAARPTPPDRDYLIDERTGLASGPNFGSFDSVARRDTLRLDLTQFIPDWHGQHDLKMGAVLEREEYETELAVKPVLRLIPNFPFGLQLGIDLWTEPNARNSASGNTFGMYVQDVYHPLPNLTLGLGLRFDREATDSFGYRPIDPQAERALYDRLRALGGQDIGSSGTSLGDSGDLNSRGICSDPIFPNGCTFGTQYEILQDVGRLVSDISTSRLTQHHFSTTLIADSLKGLFPDVIRVDPLTGDESIDRDLLRERGAATFQESESFRLTNNNLAPRLSVSWDPFSDGRTKLFANWSRFYDKLFLATVVPEEGPDQITRAYNFDVDGISTRGYPNRGIGSVISKAPPSATQVDRGLRTPFSDEFTFGFERELAPELALRVTYIDRKYRDQLQDTDINHSLRFDEDGKEIDAIGTIQENTRSPDGRPDLYIHNLFFNQIFHIANLNESRYKGVELALTRRLSRSWQMLASYTYSRAIGNAETFQSDLGDDPSVVEDEVGPLAFDQRHQVKLNMVTFLRGDWQIGSTLTWSSGLPYSVVDTFSAFDNADYLQNRTLYGYVGTEGNDRGFVRLNRNSERNDSIYNIDVQVQKAFVLGKLNSKVFLTVQNLLNSDDLTIYSFTPKNSNQNGLLELDSERRFGRRFEIGFHIDF